ncbi:fluoride efflux transporter CrcB [Psittacicella hinzii]|uniref:Fluoride-specific ion channel FluC n=1 Tax=Psittacicella hinzii TaxID=2028575 RepID=A0A3A1YLH0_9GAMM|nr:fluoride efflux transporter CrcB [Psittacicella hinzii]RIY37084.1 hypothetical protein CKF58_05515 [Psittacicella hinzii]
MLDFKTLGAIAIGAILGAWIRAYLSAWLNPQYQLLNVGTLVANVLGCFLIGSILVLGQKALVNPVAQQLLITGFLGSLTTFSSYSLEIWQKFLAGQWLTSVAVAVLHLLLGFIACGIGYYLTKACLKA